MAEGANRIRPILSAEEIHDRVQALASRLLPHLEEGAIGVVLLLGGLWFAADLTRALARRGAVLAYDGLWLSSYGDGQESQGRCEVRAAPGRSVAGRQVLLMDDVAESGLSLAEGRRLLCEAGSARVTTAVFARKPFGCPIAEPDFVAWEAPARFLVGYGMDYAGEFRGMPSIGALD